MYQMLGENHQVSQGTLVAKTLEAAAVTGILTGSFSVCLGDLVIDKIIGQNELAFYINRVVGCFIGVVAAVTIDIFLNDLVLETNMDHSDGILGDDINH